MTKMNDNVEKLLEKRYYLRDNNDNFTEHSWSDISQRIANSIAQAENEKDIPYYIKQFYNKINDMEFIPSSPCIFNAGTPSQSLSSCFVVDIEDNIEGIFSTVAECAKIFQMSGGAGFSMRKIRPKGSLCKSSGSNASGVCSFMHVFNEVVNRVKQGNKRNGALKIDLPCTHPEIFDFIHSKDITEDLKNMNISVSITDEFVKAVENSEDWDLKFNGLVYQTIKAIDLWNEIMLCAWKTGEPGLSYQSNMDKGNMNPQLNESVYGNPCFSGDMRLLTVDGYKTFEELSETTVKIINSNGDISDSNVWCSGEKDTIELTTSNKKKIRCTPDHIVMLNDNEECEIQYALKKRVMPYHGKTNVSKDLFVQLGFLQGDGGIGRINSEAHLGLEINIGEKDKEIFELFNIVPIDGKKAYYTNGYNNTLVKYGFDGSPLPERVFPITYTNWTKEQKLNFLKGCYSANGCVIKTHRISYKTTSKVFSLQLKKALEEFDIVSYITTNKPTMVKFTNGDYLCKESYDINIGRLDDVIFFYQNIGFMQQYKINDLVDLIKLKSPKIMTMKQLGKQKVYDFSEPLTHWGVVEGLVVHNCHEYVNIPYSSCNLASVNLKKVIEHSKVNWFKLKENIELTFRFLDDMITMNRLPLEKIKTITHLIRPIGLGTMGFAQLLYELKIPYNSQECLDFIDVLYGFIEKTCLEYNVKLGKERGIYPAWKGSKWEEENLEVRCSSMTSIAPNGSIAFIADTTGGIEPQFALVYKRRDKENDEYMVADSVFENYLKENGLYTKEILDKINENKGSIKGLDSIFTQEIQNIFVTANDISPEWHVKVLAQIQKYICLSISKTVNLPNNATIEDVGNVYLMAAKLGIKGVTVYRDGCRSNQILSVGEATEEIPKQEFVFPAETLKYAHAERFKVDSGCGSFWLFLCFDDNENLREIFSQSATQGGCQGLTEALSRMTSLALKSNIHPEVIIDQLKSVRCPVSMMMRKEKGLDSRSCADAIGNAIRDFIKGKDLKVAIVKETKTIQIENSDSTKCPECGAELGMTEGCRTCPNCFYSKCS